MRALQLSFADNKSISKKSAKTVKTLNQKKQEYEGVTSAPIYFDGNPLINQITARAQQKIKRLHVQLGYKQNHLGKAKNILQGLFQRHHEAVNRLQKLKEEAQINMKVTFPFQPSTTKPEKYLIPEGFNRRNQIWIQQKKKRQLQMREESLFEDLNRCPFSPSLVSKYESEMYLKNRQHNRSTQNPRKNKRPCERQRSLSHRQRREMSVSDYEAGKRAIFNRLYTDIN